MAYSNAAEKWASLGEKKCTRCYQVLPLSAFTIRQSGSRKGHPTSYCKACKVKRQAQNYNNDTYMRIVRPYQLKSKYGITSEDYEKLLESQSGKCAICGTDDGASAKGSSTFSIDHCHETGNVRGLLCNTCNRGLGFFKDNPVVLASAIKYLKGESK